MLSKFHQTRFPALGVPDATTRVHHASRRHSGRLAGWPLAARAQQPERMRRIGVLLPAAADDAEYQARVGAFLQELSQLGWSIGRNVRIDTRWATANAAEIRRHAAELAPRSSRHAPK